MSYAVSGSSEETYVRSPVVGKFHRAPAPGAAPFVKSGDRVSRDQVVCIVESKGLRNETEAEANGFILECCVEDGQQVEYGDKLFAIGESPAP
jgi:acetyl-CoA carboxylase biotin carboxyl carrier protein